MYVELTKSQMKKALEIYLEEMTLEEMHSFVMKTLKNYAEWDADWAKVKTFVDKQVVKNREDD